MNRRLTSVYVFILIVSIAAGVVYRKYNAADARRERLVSSLLACVPRTVNQKQRDEIRELFDRMWLRYDRGLVAQADVDTVTNRVHQVAQAGRVSHSNLAYLMAQVGYFTYRGEQKYNLPDSSVDHPTLNPASDVTTLYPDSALVAQFHAWMKKMKKEGKDPATELRRLRGLPPKNPTGTQPSDGPAPDRRQSPGVGVPKRFPR